MAEYSEDYLERCFQAWYAANQPSDMVRFQEIIPESPEGTKPGKAYLGSMISKFGWAERADAMNAIVTQKVEQDLMADKYEMLKRHAQRASEISEKAYEHVLQNGFDSSNSATAAYFKATEEERTVTGIGKIMIKISKATDEELKAEAYKLLKRVNAVDGEVIDPESMLEENANLGSTTSE